MIGVYEEAREAFETDADWSLRWDPDSGGEVMYDLVDTDAYAHVVESDDGAVATLKFPPFKEDAGNDDFGRAKYAHIDHFRRDLVASSDLDFVRAGDFFEFIDYMVSADLEPESDMEAYVSEFADFGRRVQDLYDERF